MTRHINHLTILTLLCCLPLLAAAQTPVRLPDLAPSEPAISAAPADQAGAFVAGGPAGGLQESASAEQLPLPSRPPVEVAQVAASPRQPPIPRPGVTWLQAFKTTVLWDSDRSSAASRGGLPQWTSFRLLGGQSGQRLPVEYPGDGVASLPQRGWVDAVDVGPAGRPNPEWELASGGEVNPSNGVATPRRVVQAWPQGISAQFAALVDSDSGQLLWGRNASSQVAPASLTKIVTSLVALDRSRLTDRVAVDVDSRGMWDSTIMGLTPGENLSMETLLFGLMLPSGNDAALAIARAVGGSEDGFVKLMNAKAAELGLKDSHFANPHGLDAADHYSSPYDLCMFSRDGMRNPTFARLAGTRQYVGEGYTLNNLNRLLALYPKADGVKVGYTDNAGRAIVGSATQNGHRVYVALIRSNNPVPEAQALLEWAFNGFTWS